MGEPPLRCLRTESPPPAAKSEYPVRYMAYLHVQFWQVATSRQNCQGGEGAAAFGKATKQQQEFLPVERAEHRESVPGRHLSEINLVVHGLPDVFTCMNKPHRFCLEIVAGCSRLTAACNTAGMPTYAIDTCLFPSHDVLDPATTARSLKGLLVLAGMPCTTFSCARKRARPWTFAECSAQVWPWKTPIPVYYGVCHITFHSWHLRPSSTWTSVHMVSLGKANYFAAQVY